MTISPSRPLPAPPWETGQPVRMTWTEALAWFDRYRPEVVAVVHRGGRTVAVVRPRGNKNQSFQTEVAHAETNCQNP